MRRAPKLACVVYGLYDCEGSLRYIGQTRQLLSERLRWFYKQVRRSRDREIHLTPVEIWVEECAMHEIPIRIDAIDPDATWDISEIIHIDRAKQAGVKLLNVLRGGNDSVDNMRRSKSH